ncbi:MAG: glycerol-3-phosphate responsive antiterminator [Bacillota bacterium]|jgi:glycerol uptake operon antiterminator|nr:glycerol-3-phosphate responsive antiterminator [Bacillota bacterium]
MGFYGQEIIPAMQKMEDLEKLMVSNYTYIIVLEVHVSRLKPIFQMAQAHNKKLILHMDLVHGLKSDEYATEFVCQELKPFGIISTKSSVILKAKQKGVTAIQRMFLIDSYALEKSYKLIEKTKPDFIEVLPGAIPQMITEVKKQLKIPIFAGGLIRTMEEVQNALNAGAEAVTTSRKELWNNEGL